MHRVQFTQMTCYNLEDVVKEIRKIIHRYPEAYSTSVYIQWRPTCEWPKKWSEV